MSSPPIKSDKVWATLITKTSYLPGLLTLNHSLHLINSAYPLIALTPPSLPPLVHAVLAARSIPIQPVSYLQPPPPHENNTNNTSSTYYKETKTDPRFDDCWTKLSAFSLTQYSRIVLLDADMLILQNMDELMTLPISHDHNNKNNDSNRDIVFAAGLACTCNPLHKKNYPPDWIPQNCPFTRQHSYPSLAQNAPPPITTTKLSSSSSSSPTSINGGLLILQPSQKTYLEITQYLNDCPHHAFPFAEQSLLSELYQGRWKPLPYVYNALKTMRWEGVHSDIWRDDEVKNVHYILGPKPWEEIDGEDGRWIGTDESHWWWVEVDRDRRRRESEMGVIDDGF